MADTNSGIPAGPTFYGAGGHFDVRGRKAVIALQEEHERDRIAREISVGKSRLALAEEASQQRKDDRRQMLPNSDNVSLPWLFDQVVSELDTENTSLYTSSTTTTGNSKQAQEDSFLMQDEEIDTKIPWWKKRKKAPIVATLSDMFDVGAEDKEEKEDKEGQEDTRETKDDPLNDNVATTRYTGNSKNASQSPSKRYKFNAKEVYQHRFSSERIHDSESKIYSDLDKAASMMELREAVVKQNKRIHQHPKRDADKKIIANPYAVGSDERMYQYHYWGDRSINISAPTSDILHVVRDDLQEHVSERLEKKEILIREVKLLREDLTLAKHTKTNLHDKYQERKVWYDHQLHATHIAETKKRGTSAQLEEEKSKTRKEIFANAQAEIMLYRDRARYLNEPQCHKFVRAFFWRCCNTGMTCWGNRTANKDHKGCWFHCCSTCWCKTCINKYDVDTTLATLRNTKGRWLGCREWYLVFFGGGWCVVCCCMVHVLTVLL